MNTLAGGTLPAAVIWPLKKRPKALAASITARYPLTPAVEVSASIFWARDSVRGRQSMASTVAFLAASCCIRSGFWAGQMKSMRVVPSRIRATSSPLGGRTLKTMSDAAHSDAASLMISAPAAR